MSASLACLINQILKESMILLQSQNLVMVLKSNKNLIVQQHKKVLTLLY